ncbi:MAG: hypothetical protein WA087_04035 [Candidatus Saccharimonadales bacterium]
MKTISSKLFISIIASLTLVLVSVTPAVAVVAEDTVGKASVSCARVTTLKSTQVAAMSARMASLRTEFTNRAATLNDKEASLDQKVDTARETAKKQFETKITAMLAESGLTDAQKEAINSFKTSMEQAMEIRQTAVDKARSDYRTALSTLVQNRQQAMLAITETLQASIQAAFDTAVLNCSQDGNMTTLRASIKTARDTYQTSRNSIKVKEDIQAIAAIRNTAVQGANKIFADSAQTLSVTLSTALAASTDSTTN